jgi:phytoene desaturase
MTKKAIIIGGGFAGMASALRLKAKGYAVQLIDQCPQLGGRAQVYYKDGFVFDAGPTVLTAPFLFTELFALFQKDIQDYVKIVPLPIWYRFVFNDGRHFDYGGTLEETLAEIEKFSPADRDNYLKLLKHSQAIFEIGFEKLGTQPFHSFWTMLKILPHLLALQGYRTVWQMVSSHLKDDALRQAFSIQPLLVGGNPFTTTSIYALIHYLERKWGVHFAMGGTGALVKALEKLMVEEGVTLTLNTAVKALYLEKRVCRGVILANDQVLKADVVVANADAAYLYQQMIPKQKQALSARIKTKFSQFSMGLFVLYFGTTVQYPTVQHHTIVLGKRYQGLLDDIFHKKILATDFSLYLHRPTATDSSLAPMGCDSFYVLVPVPNLQAQIDWATTAEKFKEAIIARLEQTVLPKLSQTITADFYKTPQDFYNDYSSLHGAGFSIAPLLRQSAWFRYHNQAEGVENLYLCGAGTHPGAGLPGVITSAKLLDALIPAPGV